ISGRSPRSGHGGSCSLHIGCRQTAALYYVRSVFLKLLDRTGLRGANAGRDPRIHDLRHTFAVRSLELCGLDRIAVTQHIVALSTYLGHVHVRDSFWYLQATPVLMGQIADAGEALLKGGAA